MGSGAAERAVIAPAQAKPDTGASSFSPYALAAALCGAALFMSRRRRVG